MYIKKGPDVVEENIKVLDLSMDYLRELNTNLLTLNEEKMIVLRYIMRMLLKKEIKVWIFLNIKMELLGGTSSSDKENITCSKMV